MRHSRLDKWNSVWYLTIPIIAAFFVVTVLLIFAHVSGSLIPKDTILFGEAQPDTVWARRFLTPTFGIDATLLILNEGQQVLVSGHGNCGSGGETYDLRVTVTQELSGTKGKGKTEGSCSGEEAFSWSTPAKVHGPRRFEPGHAQVCAQAVVHSSQDGAIVQKWCKEVILEDS